MALLSRGINVITTSPCTAITQPKQNTSHGFLLHLTLDTTSSTSLLSALNTIYQLTDGCLQFLINMQGDDAGGCTSLLDADVEGMKRGFEIKVCGMLATTQTFFPLLRAGKGVIVNQVGEERGSLPFQGLQTSGAAAVRSLSETMRVEMRPFGVRVVGLVVPSTGQRAGGVVPETSVYASVREVVEKKLGGLGEAYEWEAVAEGIVEEFLKDDPPDNIRRGHRASCWAFLYWSCPTWMKDAWNARGLELYRLHETYSRRSVDETKQD